jgi:hypothetical protein
MATATRKITLSTSCDIPFNKLVLSQSNVRRVKSGISIEELAEDIAHRSLLQSLNVRVVVNAEGVETGMFEGARRRPQIPGARAPGEAEAHEEDPAGALHRADRWHRRGGFARRKRPACSPPSAGSVPRLPDAAREGSERGGHRGPLLRASDRRQAASSPQSPKSSSTSMPRMA